MPEEFPNSRSDHQEQDTHHNTRQTHQQVDKGQSKTNYPISRLEAFRMFKKPIQPFEKVHPPYFCQDIIEDHLDQMYQYGFNFYLQYHNRGFKRHRKNIFVRRKVKARFYCRTCSNPFTSILGNFEVSFSIGKYPPFEKPTGKGKTNQLDFVKYHLRLYRMRCEKCFQFCNGSIYQSQLKAVATSFCIVLAQILEGVQNPKHRDKRHKSNPLVHNHREELCEACEKGVCFNIPKGENDPKKGEENTNHVDHSSEDQKQDKGQKVKKKPRREYQRRDYNRQKGKRQKGSQRDGRNQVPVQRRPRREREQR